LYNLSQMRTPLFAPVFCILGLACALAQTPAPTNAPAPLRVRQPWELEWAYLSRYRDADAKLGPPQASEKRVVFLGDSITQFWGETDGKFFSDKPYVNRGIGGQTTSQMLVRFRQDVIGLTPAVVVILGGTNDIAENGGLTTLEAIEENLQSMVELARLHGIRVVLASVLPTLDYPWRPGLKPADKISGLNRWMEEFCTQNHLVYLDYYSAMVDASRAMRPDLSGDGVHPDLAGYLVMEPLTEEAIRTALE
jgi:lysophospholipase L1-like esterase